VRVGKATSQTKIGKLDLAIGGYQQVVWLDIAMQDKVLVAEPDGAGQHGHPGFDIAGAVVDCGVLNQFHKITLGQLFKDKVQVLVLGREDGE
jgi:hypothetical protein